MGNAVEISPIALGILVVGYVAKRWWDRSIDLRDKREEFYEEFLERTNLFMRSFDRYADGNSVSFEEFQKKFGSITALQTKLKLYGSFRVMKLYADFVDAASDAMSWIDNESANHDEQILNPVLLAEAKLLMGMRKDLYGFSASESTEKLLLRIKEFGREK